MKLENATAVNLVEEFTQTNVGVRISDMKQQFRWLQVTRTTSIQSAGPMSGDAEWNISNSGEG